LEDIFSASAQKQGWEGVPCPKCGKLSHFLVFGGEKRLVLYPSGSACGRVEGIFAYFSLMLKEKNNFFCVFCRETVATTTAEALCFLHARGRNNKPLQK